MKKILIVDDNNMNLNVARRILQKEGYSIESAGGGKEALERLDSGQLPDLILLDIIMPDDIDGFQVMEKLRADPKLSDIPVIFLTAERGDETEEACFKAGAFDFISKPFVPAIMVQRVHRIMELQDYRKNLELIVQQQLQSITRLQTDIILSMANLVESRDGTTGNHVRRTSSYLNYLVEKLLEKGMYKDILTPEYTDYVCKAAPLHDIGKIAVPDMILQKPGRFTPEEYKEMQKHSAEGGRLIQKNMRSLTNREFVDVAVDMATHHHERIDGKGYPDHLHGDEIPFSARLMAVVDVFDALTSKRQYKEAMPYEQAVSIMLEGRGTQFQADLVDAFLSDPEQLQNLRDSMNPET